MMERRPLALNRSAMDFPHLIAIIILCPFLTALDSPRTIAADMLMVKGRGARDEIHTSSDDLHPAGTTPRVKRFST
jgi:hypothetical protein